MSTLNLHDFVIFADLFGDLGFGDADSLDEESGGHQVEIQLQRTFQILINFVCDKKKILADFNLLVTHTLGTLLLTWRHTPTRKDLQ